MSGNPGGMGGDGLTRSPNLQQQSQQQPQDQQDQRDDQDFSSARPRGPMLSSGHGLSSQPRTTYDTSSAGSISNARDSTGAGGYRGHPSPTPSLGMPGFSSKLSGGIHQTIPNQSSFQVYNTQPMHHPTEAHHQHQQPQQPQHQQHQQQQHGLPSPTHAGNPMRLIPPPLSSSQASMSGMIPSPLGSGGSGRGYSPYGHPGSAPPHSPGLTGPVMSSSGGHMTVMPNMGMPYGGGGPGVGVGGVGGPGSSYMGRGRPSLYSHNSLHTHHLNPHQIGHHHLPAILSGKSHHGPGGPTAVHERPFRCDQCPQSFNRNHDLKRHKRIHLAVKPFPCNYCEKSFSRKDALKRHRLVKGCGERSSDNSGNSGNSTSSAGGIHPPGVSVLSDSTSDGGHDGHGLLG
ncbi:hypothetical protein SCUCBS95973_003546 [Sporothrix curviconia]|uniref:C2H2-type domain-containing protein n=1 Tax=Sporothrix curviconia TaxID=1260050 RepID=A0ABP0BHB0_9PEZI